MHCELLFLREFPLGYEEKTEERSASLQRYR